MPKQVVWPYIFEQVLYCNSPQPVTMTNYNCHVKKLSIIAAEQCEKNMLGAEKHLKSFLKRNENEIVDLAVTVDGTCQNRKDMVIIQLLM